MEIKKTFLKIQAEKRLIVYKDGEPVNKFYVKRKHTLSVIEKYVSDRYPGYYHEK